MLETAFLDVRVLPWRPRARVLKSGTLRDVMDGLGPPIEVDDLHGLVIGLAVWLAIIIAAPLVVLLLAAGLLSVELPVILVIALVLVVIRFAGLLPWEVVVVGAVTGAERRERYRSLWHAARRVQGVNGGRGVKVRWAWS